jgi:hypothetical protein
VQNDTGLASVSALVGVSQTLTLALAGFTADMIGNQIRVYGAATLDNNGIFLITGQTATTLTYTNPNAGAGAEAAGTLNFVAGENMCASLGGPPPDTATGGEEFLYLQNKPVVGTALALTQVTSGGAATALVRGVPPVGQYSVRESNGLIKFDPALAIGDTVFADYEYYTGLISAAQKVVDGDPNDRLNYPGYRAAGIDVQVKAPTQRVIAVTGVLTITRGFERTVVRAAAEANVVTYVNGLGISGDVIRSEIIEQIMATPGVYNVTLSAPTRGVTVINDDQVARTDTTQVALT